MTIRDRIRKKLNLGQPNRKNLIFIAVPKTGSQSVALGLEKFGLRYYNPNHLDSIKILIEENKDIQLIRTFTNPVLALQFLKENKIDLMNESLSPMTHFILPGGNKGAARAHIARCVCRRAERIVVQLSRIDFVDEKVLIYLNRLSDYLFCLARALAIWDGKEEIKWIPSK